MSTTNLAEYTDKELLTIYENLQKQMTRVGAEIKRRKAKTAKKASVEEASPGVIASLISLVSGGGGEEAPKKRVASAATKAKKAQAAAAATASSSSSEDEKPVRVTMAHLKSAYKKKTGDNPPSGLSKEELEEEVRKVGALRLAKAIASA